MESIHYQIDDKSLAQLLGRENFASANSAVLELVKNAFDAGSTETIIDISPDRLLIKDNGCGMSINKMRNAWTSVGVSDKGYTENGRVLSGSKGVGRFAMARLGRRASVVSKAKDSRPIIWKTDWESNELDYLNGDTLDGTVIEITLLNDDWTLASVRDLQRYLSRSTCDDAMKIILLFEGGKFPILPYFDEIKIGVNVYGSIDFSFDPADMQIRYSISLDEFEDKASLYYLDHPIYGFSNVRNALDFHKPKIGTKEERKNDLLDLGPISGTLYFVKKSVTKENRIKYLMKPALSETADPGVVLYRNSFSIDSYDGSVDWLDFGARAAASPAAISHPGFGWRARAYQVTGFIRIDKKENPGLRDLSNRQGLEKNRSFDTLCDLVSEIFREFERFRQSIVHAIIRHSPQPQESEKPYSAKAVRDPSSIARMNSDELNSFVEEIKKFKIENDQLKARMDDQERRSLDESRVLYALSTLGLSISESAHDFHNHRNNILALPNSVRRALVWYDLWDVIEAHPNSKFAGGSVPIILDSCEIGLRKVDRLASKAMARIEKSSFEVLNDPILSFVQGIASGWKSDYASLNFSIACAEDLFVPVPKDVISAVLDNLILNSFQQNRSRNDLVIRIEITQMDRNSVKILYSDDGKGLVGTRYLDDPMRILEPFETSKTKDGHGLGMYIVNNAIASCGGRIDKIDGYNGFKIWFVLKGEING